MAIQHINGTFRKVSVGQEVKSVEVIGNKTYYRIYYGKRKDYPNDHIKWCRRNLGERGVGWDFTFISNMLTIEIWDDKLKFMYEIWKQ